VGVHQHRIELGGAPVFYASAPAGEVPPVYLHGVPTSSDDFATLLARTGGIAPDLPGFGRSVKAGHLDYTIDAHADFVESLLAELGIDRLALVAHGWGAGGGLVFAQRHPERVQRLVLIDALPLLPGFHWGRLGRALRRPGLGEAVMGCTLRSLFNRHLRSGSTTAEAWAPERLAAAWEQFDQGTQRAVLRMIRDMDPARLARAGAGLGELEAPALVLWGARDPWLPAVYAERYAARLPNAELRLAPGAGHWPWLDEPALVDAIADFLG
jgi:pimeloyl-ACP methyl ester carboxylesterase